MFRKLVLIHACFVILSASIFYVDLQGPNLIWNMFLALLALDLAAWARFSQRSDLKILLLSFWLFFYPNTFYMLTDMVHMHFTSTVLWERSSMILFMLYVPSILLGVFSGILSVRYVFDSLNLKQPYLRLFLVALLSFVASFGIHIGRYARLNTWDIFTRPLVVMEQILAVVSHEALPFILGFTFIQFMALLFMELDD